MSPAGTLEEKRRCRHDRVRRKISGTAARPRLCVFRSAKNIFAQLIDDAKGQTLAAASTIDPDLKGQKFPSKIAGAKAVGLLLASRGKQAGIGQVVFDRAGYLYHGRVKALSEGAREGGLAF
jgi:large subunit ribosomal protein L18